MYQHIIVAIDGSNNSNKALEEAIRITQGTEAKLTIFHAANLRDLAVKGVGLLGAPELHDLACRDGKEALEHSRALAQEKGVKNVDIYMAESWNGGNEMAELLVDFASTHNGDLIILGTHGRSGLAHLLLGSFAEAVLRRANCPVMVIRDPD